MLEGGVRQLTWLDLCSGLGGSSQPALDRGWRVIRVDIDPRFKPDIVCDLLDPLQAAHLMVRLDQFHVNVGWASPVCTEFTKAGLPQSWAANRKRPPKPDTTLSQVCWRIIQDCADWPILENVGASRRFLSPLFGRVAAQMEGHVLWGRLPCLLPQTRGHKWRLPPSSDRAAIRGKIPFEIGEAICRAVEARESDKSLSG